MVTENEARIFLRSYRMQKCEIKRIELTIEELRLSMIMPSKENDGMPHAKNNTSDLSGYIEKLEELIDKLIKRQKKAQRTCEQILKEIDRLEDAYERSALNHHYICGMTWEETAEEMKYSRAQIFRIQDSAIKNIAKQLKKT